MKNRKKLVREIIELLLRNKWVNLFGPTGIGKQWIVSNVNEFILKEHRNTHLPLILNLEEIKAYSVNEVEKELLSLITKKTNIDISDGVDFFDCIKIILEKIQKKIILLLTNIDIVSQEGAQHIAKELSKIYHLSKDKYTSHLAVLVCGGRQLIKLSTGKTSPFHHSRSIKVIEMDKEETKEFIHSLNPTIPDKTKELLYKETAGYPLLIEELVQELDEDLLRIEEESKFTDRLATSLIKKNNDIKSDLIKRWLFNISRPEFLSVLYELLNSEKYKISETKLFPDEIDFSGIFKVEGKYVKFRNSFIKKFSQKYATKKRMADHFLMISSQDDSCWEKGIKIYRGLSEEEKKHFIGKVVGPIFKRIEDIITSGGILMAKKESDTEVLEILDNILEYLFNIRYYFVGKRISENKEYRVLFAPKTSKFQTGKMVEGSDILDLLERCLRENRDWVHSWNYGFLAFPLIRDPKKHIVLWIDNKSGVVNKKFNRTIASLSSTAGMAISHLEKRETLQDDLDLLKKVLDYDEDYVQFVDMDKKIKMMNKRAEENAKKWLPDKKQIIGENCNDLFLHGRCSKQCACYQVFEDRKVQRRPETWINPNDKTDVRYMDVISVPLIKDNKMEGVFQIARDVTLLRKAMEAIIDFSSAKTEEKVFSILLKAIINQGAKRVRLYLPSDNWENKEGSQRFLISKDYLGYDDDPEFKKKFKSGKFKPDGKIEEYWYEPQRRKKKPIISRIKEGIEKPEIDSENRSVLIFNVPPKYDTCRIEVKKEKVEEWMGIGLFAGGKFFGMISIDKGLKSKKGSFRIIECDRMLGTCRSAALALHRISVPNIQKVVQVFRHSIAQHLDAINHFIWTFAESNLPKGKREAYAKIVDKELQRFDYFSRNLAALLPEMGRPTIFPRKLNIKKNINEIKELFYYHFQKSCITFKTKFCSSIFLPSVHTDEMVVRIILNNLLNNSINSLESWPRDKKIIIECKRGGINDLVISVIDTGPGITEEDQERIFDPGYSGKEGQTGIGLPASKFMAEWINATLTFDKKYRDGAKFDLRLPDLS